jgi:hypothetical protein
LVVKYKIKNKDEVRCNSGFIFYKDEIMVFDKFSMPISKDRFVFFEVNGKVILGKKEKIK